MTAVTEKHANSGATTNGVGAVPRSPKLSRRPFLVVLAAVLVAAGAMAGGLLWASATNAGEVVLEPGDAIFIPSMWWHHVQGLDPFTVLVNYRKNMIKSYFADLDSKRYRVDFVDEEEPLGTGGGLSLLKGQITSTFFLTNCDVLIDADFGDLYDFHQKNGNLITMVCAFKHLTIPYGVIELGSEGEIKDVTEKPEMNFLTNTGVYVVEPRVIDELREGEAVGFPDIMERYRHAGEKVGVYPVSESSWMDMGQLEELENMRRKMEEQNI